MKYIIADPDEQNGIELKEILDGYKTLVFQGRFINFEDTENSIRKESPDIAFVRIGKAELNAFKLAEDIQELNPLSKVIFISSNVDYAVEAFDCGVDGFLFIPFNREKIECLFGSWMNKREHKEKDIRGSGYRR